MCRCSFAWYSATAAASITGINAQSGNITTSAVSLAAESYKLKVTYNGAITTIALSDPTGGAWGVDGANKLRAATGSPTVYANLSTTSGDWVVTVHDATTGDALEGDDLNVALANLKATNKTYPVTVQGGSRVRLSNTDPEGGFAVAFGGAGTGTSKIGQTVTAGTVSFATGAGVFTSTQTVYYSISGNTTNAAVSDGDEVVPEAELSGAAVQVTVIISEP